MDAFQRFQQDQQRALEQAMREEQARKEAEAKRAADQAARDKAQREAEQYAKFAQSHHVEAKNYGRS